MMKKVDADHYLTSAGKVVPVIRTIIFNVPECLQDEVAELVYEFGHSRTEIGCEGIRSFSDTEGIVHRRRDFAIATNTVPEIKAKDTA